MFYDPFGEIRRLHEYLDRVFEDFMRAPVTSAQDVGFVAPPVDVVDEGDKIRIVAEIPGVNKEDLDVRVYDDSVVIRAERKSDREQSDRGYYIRERSYSTYYRTIALPAPVVPEKAEATYRNGVLELILPKRVPEKQDGGFRVSVK
ncbi:MAG: Hsp20/alpha crystallin family protein [Candidatus Diapherotrites archaeon]|nr:Hsp20/alpha crystallin family protein [Candidatus Diapherotrites archaeon]